MAGTWEPPETFEEYHLIRPIGRGGMGQVYLAHDLLLDRPVAVKFIASAEPDAAARERFFVEARAVARLQHPNVVAVHRVGEIGRRPYLISEFVRGQGLDRLDKPVPTWRALAIGISLARGLANAHRHGVLHRDVKPGNAMITDDGEIKLLDFGIAKLLDQGAPPRLSSHSGPVSWSGSGSDSGSTSAPADPQATATLDIGVRRQASAAAGTPPKAAAETGEVIGSPLYMAPEVWRGEPASRESDIYSLGVLLYELVAGAAPHSGLPFEELRREVLAGASRPLAEAAPGVDPRLAEVIDRCLAPEPERRFSSGEALREALERIAAERSSLPVPEGNPYRGLAAFHAEHRGVYFGRGDDVRGVLERLRSTPVVLVAGDSGVGKSSLCHAGVLPAAVDGALEDGREWSVVTMVPGSDPVGELAAALAPRLGDRPDAVAGELCDDPAGVARALSRRLGTDRGLVVFIDQLEELLTLASAADAARFGEIAARIGSAASVRLLMTVRSDFLGRLAALPALGEQLSAGLYLLRPLSPDGTREAIVGPARAKGVDFESPEMVEELVASALRTAGGLPLLQFALAELWEARDPERHMITAAAMAQIGGVEGALARHADGIIAGLTGSERDAARQVLVRLVTADGTRTRRSERELVPREAERTAKAALDALVRGRLLVARGAGEAEGGAFEIAHEALLSGWDTLRDWLGRDAGRRLAWQRLRRAAAEWEQLGRPAELLWSRQQLREVRDLHSAELGDREAEFWSSSLKRARRRRLWQLVPPIAAVLAAAGAFTGFEIWADMERDRVVDGHVSQARQALTDARDSRSRAAEASTAAYAHFDAHERDHDELTLDDEAHAALDAQEYAAGERRWAEALRYVRDANAAYAEASQELERALVIDGGRSDVHELLADSLFERALLAERFGDPDQFGELVLRLAAHDAQGRRIAQLDEPAAVAIESRPQGAVVSLARIGDAEGRRLPVVAPAPVGLSPIAELELEPGSYLFELDAPGRAPVRVPVLLERGERAALSVALPDEGRVPPEFVYVPAGRVLFGADASEDLRRVFLFATPMHPVTTDAYLIARSEVTFADWIEYLEALPEAERAERMPAGESLNNALTLSHLPDVGWVLRLRPTAALESPYIAGAGQAIVYPDRPANRRRRQDWLRFPVAGISYDDARAYAAWLSQTGRVPGARLCTEWEWERAARGADGRTFPSGDYLAGDDANIDETYGRKPRAFGPDEVGSHPVSRSPYGVDDMAGNVWEWVVSVRDAQPVRRGGSWYHGALTARSANRSTGESSQKDPRIGLRVCADAPAG